MNITTPKRILEDYKKLRLNNLRANPNDIYLLRIYKKFFRSQVWHWLHDGFLTLILTITKQLNVESSSAQLIVHNLMDWYSFFYTLFLLVVYTISFYINVEIDKFVVVAAIFCFVVAAYRVIEILATFAALHSKETYHSKNPVRALVRTFISYAHFIIAFAVLFMIIGDLSTDLFINITDDDNILNKGLKNDFISPIYFSLVTITTLGYGDLSPQKWPCKLLVMLQVSIGILTIAIIVQRVMAITNINKDISLNRTRTRRVGRLSKGRGRWKRF